MLAAAGREHGARAYAVGFRIAVITGALLTFGFLEHCTLRDG